MPDSTPGAPGGTTLQALQVALQGSGLEGGGVRLKPTFKHLRSYRTATKQLLHAMRNCLQLLVPEYDFGKSVPSFLLEPRGNRDRYELGPEGKKLVGADMGRKRFFLHDPSTGKSIPDYPPLSSPSPLRLVFAGDEGSDNFGAFLHLAHSGVLAVWWGDLPHKLHRKQAGALKDCQDASSVIKIATRAFRSSRGPWSTARFGRGRQESRRRMIAAMEEFGESNLLQCSLSGMARDQGMNASEMTAEHAMRLLKMHAGPSQLLPKTLVQTLTLRSRALVRL